MSRKRIFYFSGIVIVFFTILTVIISCETKPTELKVDNPFDPLSPLTDGDTFKLIAKIAGGGIILELDKTFEERDNINVVILQSVDKASDPWGVKITRYEVKNITPPQSIKDAMEKQMRAEREKRATIAESEGERQAKINVSEGDKQELIRRSEGEKQKRINEAEGSAAEILKVAEATAEGIRKIAISIKAEGGKDAVNLRIAEQYIGEFGNLAKENNTMIIPTNMADISSIIATVTSVIEQSKKS